MNKYSGRQFCFANGVDIREAVFGLHTLLQCAQEHQQEVHFCFIVYERASDIIRHHLLPEELHKIGEDYKDMLSLHWKQSRLKRESIISVHGHKSYSIQKRFFITKCQILS